MGISIGYNKYNGENYKFFCNSCLGYFFSNTRFEDLCDLCESERIYEVEITDEDKDMVDQMKRDISIKEEEIKVLKYKSSRLDWIKG